MNHALCLWGADLVLLLHWAVVGFIVGGGLAVWVGHGRGWRWVHGWTFRLTHLVTVLLVIAQAWLGQSCPLTQLESWLREQAGQFGYETTFLEHWTHRFLYYEAPSWVFGCAYSLFGVWVLWTWWRFPPRRPTVRTGATSERRTGPAAQ
ncbi:MAG: DUF2784 domain-containing protein [Verrucomicrobiota bacterium]|nr:DUF2784 domain-containing protein [Limisphaera sp.]MDW8381542.1 DUF2784 domain-containing protein [Verrucomicrobiota bacterium]